MDRFWLLTWTTYGTWLPGDPRGFVSNVWSGPGPEIRHNQPTTTYDSDIPGLMRSASDSLKCSPIWLKQDHADLLLAQLCETATHRCWTLFAVAIMPNHAHIVVGVPGDPEPSKLLQDFKAYGSRPLNRKYGKPGSGTWWTEGGSKRKLPDDDAIGRAISYVRDQANPLVVWLNVGVIRERFGEQIGNELLGERGTSVP